MSEEWIVGLLMLVSFAIGTWTGITVSIRSSREIREAVEARWRRHYRLAIEEQIRLQGIVDDLSGRNGIWESDAT